MPTEAAEPTNSEDGLGNFDPTAWGAQSGGGGENAAEEDDEDEIDPFGAFEVRPACIANAL